MSSNLPPIPDEAFDGEKFSTQVSFPKCNHAKAKFINSELRCPCGAAWSGPNLHDLYKTLKSLT